MVMNVVYQTWRACCGANQTLTEMKEAGTAPAFCPLEKGLAAEGLPGAVLHQDVDVTADGEDRAALESLDHARAAGFTRLRRVAETTLQVLLRPEDTEGARWLVEAGGGARPAITAG